MVLITKKKEKEKEVYLNEKELERYKDITANTEILTSSDITIVKYSVCKRYANFIERMANKNNMYPTAIADISPVNGKIRMVKETGV